MTVYSFKPQFQELLRPVVVITHRWGAKPNSITLCALLLSLAYGLWMALSPTQLPYLLLPGFLLVRMALNALDGMMAREFQLQSSLGAILNEVGDVVSDAALYLPFSLLPGVTAVNVLIMVFLSLMTEFVGVLGHVTGNGRRYEGPLGKSDRAVAFSALGFFIAVGVPVLPFADEILVIACGLLVITIIRRIHGAISVLRDAT